MRIDEKIVLTFMGFRVSNLTNKSLPTGALPYIAKKGFSGAPRCLRRLGAPQTLHTPPETACCTAALPARRPGPAPRAAARYSPPLGRRPAPPAPARIWPRLAHTPPRRSGPGNRPIPAPRAHTARFPRPARPRRPRPAAPCARRTGTVALCPGDCLPRNGAVPPRPGPKGLCPQGGIKSLKVGRWGPRPPLA